MSDSILNKKATKKFILEKTDSLRKGWNCTGVSEQALDELEAFIRSKVIESVKRHPTKGKRYKHFY